VCPTAPRPPPPAPPFIHAALPALVSAADQLLLLLFPARALHSIVASAVCEQRVHV
jgi:hypothetical protein